MKTDYCGISDKGMKREINQDAIFMETKGDMALFAVADGMGGHMHGEAASGAIANEMENWWKEFSAGEQGEDFGRMVFALRQRLELANRIIYERYSRQGVCGSTAAVLMIYRENYCILSSGDSRIYCLNGWNFKQLTKDDVWENQAGVKEGISGNQLKKHPDYGKLVHAIGVSENAAVKVRTDTLKNGNRFLLCSDGLYKMCAAKDIKKAMKDFGRGRDGKELLAGLLRTVYGNGAADNVSIILVRVDRRQQPLGF